MRKKCYRYSTVFHGGGSTPAMENVGGVLCTAPGGDSTAFRRAGDGGASAPGDGPATRRTSATQRLHAGRWRQRSGATRRHGAAAGPSRRLQATGLGSSRAAGGLSAPRWPRRTHDPPQPRYGARSPSSAAPPPRSAASAGPTEPARPPAQGPRSPLAAWSAPGGPGGRATRPNPATGHLEPMAPPGPRSPRVIHSIFITKASLTYDTVLSQTCSGLQKYVYREGGGTVERGRPPPPYRCRADPPSARAELSFTPVKVMHEPIASKSCARRGSRPSSWTSRRSALALGVADVSACARRWSRGHRRGPLGADGAVVGVAGHPGGG